MKLIENNTAAKREPQSTNRAPYRVLSVTGGGLLGVIPAAMLVRLEALGRAAHGDGYRLYHSLDMVGGTSTGAIIATSIAMGLSAQDIVEIYLEDVPRGFKPRLGAFPFLQDRLDDRLLKEHFTRRTGARRLTREDLACDLTIMVKNLSRAVPMAFSTLAGGLASCDCLGAEVRGDALRLDTLLRASTAAPGLFRPAMLPIGPDGQADLCIDGGLSPFNNPALLLNMIVRGEWSGDVEVIGLGTGSSRPRYRSDRLRKQPALRRLLSGLAGTVSDVASHADSVMEHLAAQPGSRTSYRKFDLDLSDGALRALDPDLTRKDLQQMRSFALPKGKARLFDIAQAYAEGAINEALPLNAAGTKELQPETLAKTG